MTFGQCDKQGDFLDSYSGLATSRNFWLLQNTTPIYVPEDTYICCLTTNTVNNTGRLAEGKYHMTLND
jgi:hypothetical protein